jgi:hypothetical protein
MTIRVVTQFNPLLQSVNVIDVFQNPNIPFQQFNTQLTPGIGGFIVVYNESAVGLTFTLPQGDIVYHAPRLRRAYRIVGPNVVVKYVVEKNAVPGSPPFNGYAQIETTAVAPPFLATVNAGWSVVTVESYELSDRIDLRDYYLGDGREKLTQWSIFSSSNVNNSVVTLTNTGFTNLIFLREFHLGFSNTATAGSYQIQVGGVDNVTGGGSTLFYELPIGTTGNIQTPYFSKEYDTPIYTLPGGNLTFGIPNMVGMSAVTFVAFYLIQ